MCSWSTLFLGLCFYYDRSLCLWCSEHILILGWFSMCLWRVSMGFLFVIWWVHLVLCWWCMAQSCIVALPFCGLHAHAMTLSVLSLLLFWCGILVRDLVSMFSSWWVLSMTFFVVLFGGSVCTATFYIVGGLYSFSLCSLRRLL